MSETRRGGAGRLAERLALLVKYYACDVWHAAGRARKRHTFDNLWIGRGEAELAAALAALPDTELLDGPATAEYRRRLGDLMGVPDPLLVDTGHAGLLLLLRALAGESPGRPLVLVPAFTCSVVVEAVRQAGLEPRFVDVTLEEYDLDPRQVEPLLAAEGGRVLAAVVQHLFGLVSRTAAATAALCRAHGVIVIEDAAQALGAERGGLRPGDTGDYLMASTQFTKSLVTGAGGILAALRRPFPPALAESHSALPAADPAHVRRILGQIVSFHALKHEPFWRLGWYRFRHDEIRDFSLHPDERATGVIRPRRFPAALARIGLLQCERFAARLALRRAEDPRDRPGGEGPLPLLRYPALSTPERKRRAGLDGDRLVGDWFPYSFGDAPRARLLAERLITRSVRLASLARFEGGPAAAVPCRLCGAPAAGLVRRVASPYEPRTYALHRCPACGGEFFHLEAGAYDPRAVHETLDARHEEFARPVKYSPYWANQVRLIRRLLGRPIRSALDVGCRSGEFLLHLPRSCRREGVELSRVSAEAARRRGLVVHERPAQEIRFDHRYDVVTLFAVLEHLERPLDLLDALAAAVAPGGLLAVLVPTPECLKARLLAATPGARWHMHCPPVHVSFPSRALLDRHLARFGFRLVRRHFTSAGLVNPFSGVPLLGRLVNRLLFLLDEFTPLNRLPLFDHQYSYYIKHHPSNR